MRLREGFSSLGLVLSYLDAELFVATSLKGFMHATTLYNAVLARQLSSAFQAGCNHSQRKPIRRLIASLKRTPVISPISSVAKLGVNLPDAIFVCTRYTGSSGAANEDPERHKKPEIDTVAEPIGRACVREEVVCLHHNGRFVTLSKSAKHNGPFTEGHLFKRGKCSG